MERVGLRLWLALLFLATISASVDKDGWELRQAPRHAAGQDAAAAATAAPGRRRLRQQQAGEQLAAGRLSGPGGRQHQQRHVQQGTQVVVGISGNQAADGSARCPPLAKELFGARARSNTVLFAVANEAQWDFFTNWLRHVQKAGIDYYVVAAADTVASKRLAALKEPCFDWVNDSIAAQGLQWGQEGWRRMTWSKVFVLDAVVDWGFNLVVSDIDVAWFRDPMYLFEKNPQADLMFSEDGTASQNEAGDDGLTKGVSPHFNFNTGVYLLRYSPAVAEWAHAWKKFYDECKDHDQMCAYNLMRTGEIKHRDGSDGRLASAWGGRLWMGILPPSIAMNAHTLFLQQLHKAKKVDPLVVHLTWTYNGIDGKRSRMRDSGLWHDPPEYYSNGSFVTVDLRDLPEPPALYNSWYENEDMVSLHLRTIHEQLQQAYVGMALAVAAGRAFILPHFVCYCEKIWYSVVRCRVVDAQQMKLPLECPQDYIFHPGHYADDPAANGPPLDIREAGFLGSPLTPPAVKDSVLVIRPSASLSCTDCVKEEAPAAAGGPPVLLVPPALPDARLLPLLEPYRKYRVWRLSLEGVGSAARAYGGFADQAAAAAFDKRMAHITTNWCCRREEEAPRYHKKTEMTVQLSMNKEFNYSARQPRPSKA